MSFFSSTTSSYKPQVRVEGFHLPSPGTPPGSSGGGSNSGDNTNNPSSNSNSTGNGGSGSNNNNGNNNGGGGGGGGGALNDLFPHSFIPDAFRKFPPPAGPTDEFSDDLVSLMGEHPSHHQQQQHHHPHHHRTSSSSASGGNGNGGNGGGNATGGGGGGGAYDEGGYHHRTTHNIFDVSSPIPVNSNPNGSTAHTNGGAGGPGSQPSSLHSPSTSLHDYTSHPPPHFNSTLPALNSSMRYENPPDNNPLTPSSPQTNSAIPPPPSSYHAPPGGGAAGGGNNSFNRHTPSPSHSQPGSISSVTSVAHGVHRSERSRSRPPSSGAGNVNALNNGGVGPARTTRTRRGNSMSGTSPPPLGAHGTRPHAILIPGGGRPHSASVSSVVGGPMSAGANGGGWFMSGPNSNGTDYLPTPESLGSHHGSLHNSMSSHHHSHSHSHSHSQSQSGYGPFSLSPPPGTQGSTGQGAGGEMHLPPLHHMAMAPKSPMEQHLPHPAHGHHPGAAAAAAQHHNHLSGLPKSPLDHSYGNTGYGFNGVNGTGSGGSPTGTGTSPGSLPSVLGGGLGVGSAPGPGGAGPLGMGVGVGAPTGYGMGGMNMIGGMPGSAPGPGVVPPPSQPMMNTTPTGGAAGTGMGSGTGLGGAGGNGGPLGGSGAAAGVGTVADKQALLANEKRRRRRESHNAVERRRRDNINERISELATLIPECMLDGSGPPNAKDTGTSVTPPLTEDALIPKSIQNPQGQGSSLQNQNQSQDGALKQEKDDDGSIPVSVGGTVDGGGTVVKANKGMILRKSVEYIRYLQQLVTAQGARNRELEQELRKFRGSSVSSSDSPTGENVEISGLNLNAALDDSLDADDAMSLGIGDGDGMVLHDEFVASPTLSNTSAPTAASNGTVNAASPGMKARKGHHRHSSSTSKPKPPRLPSMPEEDMEVDKLSNAGDFSTTSNPATNMNGVAGGAGDESGSGEGDDHLDGLDALERGRTRDVRNMGAMGMGLKEELGEDVDHSMGGMDMFGMMNGHHGHGMHHHHAAQHQQQQEHGVMW